LAEKHLNGETGRFISEFRFLQKDGNWLWVLGRGKIIEQDENGNPLRFVGTHTDISEQKLIEEQLSDYQLQLEDIVDFRTQELNERITEVERLNIALTNILDDYQAANEKLTHLGNNLSVANQELESLTYSLSTDLMEPIQIVQETAEKLVKNKSKNLSEKDLSSLKHIQESATQVKQQIADLLRISQLSLQELQLVEIDPGKLVQEVLNSFSSEIKDYEIKTEIKDLPVCIADRELLELVFESLVSNGIKYSADQKSPEILVGYQPDLTSDRVIYFVQDNGIGFDQEAKNIVFDTLEKLPSAKNRQGGGIGLTLAKLIINKHNGKIWAESEEGKGATFFFDLPSPEVAEQASSVAEGIGD
jgi:light-regulated signal transduction histidine kinase (bacteriophytochrome)